jgi:hypothetical protein
MEMDKTTDLFIVTQIPLQGELFILYLLTTLLTKKHHPNGSKIPPKRFFHLGCPTKSVGYQPKGFGKSSQKMFKKSIEIC